MNVAETIALCWNNINIENLNKTQTRIQDTSNAKLILFVVYLHFFLISLV